MKTKVNEWLTNLPKDERDHLLKPENRWQLCDRVWNEAIRTNTLKHQPLVVADRVRP